MSSSHRARPSGEHLFLGVDIGSTTAVAVNPRTTRILWADYQRHETRQAEKVMELLVAVGDAFQDTPLERVRVRPSTAGGVNWRP